LDWLLIGCGSNNGLTKISPSVVDLRHLTAVLAHNPNGRSISTTSLTLDDEQEQESAAVDLYLSSNSLTSSSFPESFFQLGNLRVLTLRNNALTELPSSICRLSGLKELSIGGNQIVRSAALYFCFSGSNIKQTDIPT
jgi:Leucine-rich repeat (LRR) protein